MFIFVMYYYHKTYFNLLFVRQYGDRRFFFAQYFMKQQ